MGRVRRYKKIKSCDPFAKKKAWNGSTEASKHDEPPAMFVERRNKAENMKTKGLTGEDLDELMLQREALRELAQKREHGQDASGKRKQKQLEGKKEGESMKAFKKRIRQETRRTLHEELSNISSTSLKRKEKLKERKQKRKEMKQKKKSGDKDNEDSLEFHQAEDGRIRASDRGGPAVFPTKDVVLSSSFIVHSVDRPPEIDKDIQTTLSKRKRNHDYDDGDDNKGAAIKDGNESNSMLGIGGMKLIRLNNAKSAASNKSKQGKGSSADEMEQIRERVQQAYKLVKEKRKNANGGRLYTM